MIRTLPLLLLFTACQSHGSWQYQNIPAKEIGHCTRLLYPSKDPAGGIDLEFIQGGENLATYLQVHFGPIQDSEEDPQKAKLLILSSGKKTTIFVDFHEGNQRLRLSSSQQTLLLSLLEKGEPITLRLDGYEEMIDPTSFEKLYKKLESPPYRLPFHLPI